MKNKSEITYWLVQPGEDLGTAIDITRTMTTKVPEVGEVINLNTSVDYESLYRRFIHLTPEQINGFICPKDSQVKGDFVVYSVKRWIKTASYAGKLSEAFPSYQNTSDIEPDVPLSYEKETFEVYIQPFRNTELTETSITKLRNKMSPVYGYLQVVKAIKDKEIDSEELGELFNKLQNQAVDSIEDVVDFMRDEKNWK